MRFAFKDNTYFHPRYKKFAVGTNDEVEVVAGANCCNQHMRLLVTDVDGNSEEFTAYGDQYGESTYMFGKLTKTAFWGIVGGAIALVLIIIIVVTWCCCKKYRGYNATGTG